MLNRWAVTLDADYLREARDMDGEELLSDIERMRVVGAVHTTWSSRDCAARMRVILPLNRLVVPMEYAPIARLIMSMLGADKFDHTCQQTARLMYGPSAETPSDFWLGVYEGNPLDADVLLAIAGGPDLFPVREELPPSVEKLAGRECNQLIGLVRGMANCVEGNRDSYLLWALKCVKDSGMNPDIAAQALTEAALHAGLEPDIVQEKIERILG